MSSRGAFLSAGTLPVQAARPAAHRHRLSWNPALPTKIRPAASAERLSPPEGRPRLRSPADSPPHSPYCSRARGRHCPDYCRRRHRNSQLDAARRCSRSRASPHPVLFRRASRPVRPLSWKNFPKGHRKPHRPGVRRSKTPHLRRYRSRARLRYLRSRAHWDRWAANAMEAGKPARTPRQDKTRRARRAPARKFALLTDGKPDWTDLLSLDFRKAAAPIGRRYASFYLSPNGPAGKSRLLAHAAGRVSILGCRRNHHLRWQSAAAAATRALVLSGLQTVGCENGVIGSRDRRRAVYRSGQRKRGAGAGKQPDQAAQAEIQRPAARRQDLSLHPLHRI